MHTCANDSCAPAHRCTCAEGKVVGRECSMEVIDGPSRNSGADRTIRAVRASPLKVACGPWTLLTPGRLPQSVHWTLLTLPGLDSTHASVGYPLDDTHPSNNSIK